MGARGRAPLPKSELIARGSDSRNTNRDEVVATGGRPEAPEHWTDDQKAVHDQICDRLAALGILSVDDSLPIERWAMLQWRYWDQQAKMIGSSEVDMQGEKLLDWWEKQLRAYEDRFGMSPSARVRVRVAKRSAASELTQFLKGSGNGKRDNDSGRSAREGANADRRDDRNDSPSAESDGS